MNDDRKTIIFDGKPVVVFRPYHLVHEKRGSNQRGKNHNRDETGRFTGNAFTGTPKGKS